MSKKIILFFVLFSSMFLTTKLFAKPVLAIESWQTKAGTPVLFVRTTQVPMVDVRVMFRAGSAYDGKKWGLATMTGDLLKQGAGALSEDEIAEQFDQTGAQYSDHVGRLQASFSLRSLSDQKYLKQSFAAFLSVLHQPAFAKDSIARTKKQLFIAIKSKQQDPDFVAYNTFMQALYKDQPFSHSALGVKKTVENINKTEIKEFYQQYYVSENASVAIVGDITLSQAKKMAEQISQGFKPGKKAKWFKPVDDLKKNTVIHVDFPSKQTHVLIGQVGISRKNPDYFSLVLANHILGQQALSSRLFESIRNKHGLAYSVYSSMSPAPYRGPFFIGMQTKTNQVEKAEKVAKKNTELFCRDWPDKKRVALSKTELKLSISNEYGEQSRCVESFVKHGFLSTTP